MTEHGPWGNEGYCRCGYFMRQSMGVCLPQLKEELAERDATIARLKSLLADIIVDRSSLTEAEIQRGQEIWRHIQETGDGSAGQSVTAVPAELAALNATSASDAAGES